jgi:hypothetical protein
MGAERVDLGVTNEGLNGYSLEIILLFRQLVAFNKPLTCLLTLLVAFFVF